MCLLTALAGTGNAGPSVGGAAAVKIRTGLPCNTWRTVALPRGAKDSGRSDSGGDIVLIK